MPPDSMAALLAEFGGRWHFSYRKLGDSWYLETTPSQPVPGLVPVARETAAEMTLALREHGKASR